MKKLKPDKKISIYNQSVKSFKKKLKTKSKRKLKKHISQKVRNNRSSKYIPQKWLRKNVTLTAPARFSLNEDVEEVIKFIQLLKSYKKLNQTFKSIEIDLSQVIRIDTSSISLMLSSIKELGIYNINVSGNLPLNSDCQAFVLDSGFLEHMPMMTETLKSRMRKSNPSDKNMMIMNGKDKTDHRAIGRMIKKSIKKLTGIDAHYKPLYGVIGEMNINALEHAYKGKKHWVFAVRYDKENEKIKFTFTDNGFGIYNTLYKNFGLRTFHLLGLKSETEIVEGMFLEEYSSRFKKQYNRNRGLPAIKALQAQGKVNNLAVVTNGVYIDFEKGIKVDLKSNFSGTFYYWDLNKETYERTIGNKSV